MEIRLVTQDHGMLGVLVVVVVVVGFLVALYSEVLPKALHPHHSNHLPH
jgi:hypothetical protein